MRIQPAARASPDSRPGNTIRRFLGRVGTGQLALIVVAGALARLVVMPITLHYDAYAVYSRAHEAAYHNQWFGFTSQFVIQIFHNLWLFLIRPLLPDSANIWSDSASSLAPGAGGNRYREFLAYDHLYRAIFLMKLPYLLADLGCAWVLISLVHSARRIFVAALWLLNPLVIFTSAIWGRHDSIAILLVLLGVAAARRGTDVWRTAGLGLLGIAALARFYPVVIVPLFLLAFRRSARQLALFVGLLIAMLGAVELAGILASGRSPTLTILNSYVHYQYWFDAGLNLRLNDWIFLFPVVYLIGLLWVSERGIMPEEFPVLAASAYLLLFSLTFFHPHYAIWLVPFLALVIPSMPDSFRLTAYHAVQIVAVFVYTAMWGSWTTWTLLVPLIGAHNDNLYNPNEIIGSQIELRLFYGLFRSILTAVSFWMAWRLLRQLPRSVHRY